MLLAGFVRFLIMNIKCMKYKKYEIIDLMNMKCVKYENLTSGPYPASQVGWTLTRKQIKFIIYFGKQAVSGGLIWMIIIYEFARFVINLDNNGSSRYPWGREHGGTETLEMYFVGSFLNTNLH